MTGRRQGSTTLALRLIPGRSVRPRACERDAAELAARVYSNKAIAAELVLSAAPSSQSRCGPSGPKPLLTSQAASARHRLRPFLGVIGGKR